MSTSPFCFDAGGSSALCLSVLSIKPLNFIQRYLRPKVAVHKCGGIIRIQGLFEEGQKYSRYISLKTKVPTSLDTLVQHKSQKDNYPRFQKSLIITEF